MGIVFATTGWKIESEPVKAILCFLFYDDDRDIRLVTIKSIDEEVSFYDSIIRFRKSIDWKFYKSSSTDKMKITVKNLKFEDILERKGLDCIK